MVSTGELHPALRGLDALLREFCAEHEATGCSAAVTVGPRLVFARGYGWAHRAAEQAALPTSLYRIASVSKPLTAVGVLQLVAERRLELDQPVFELLAVEPHREEGVEPDPRLGEVTVRHCLNHSGGWDRGVSYDPMFISPRICEAMGVDQPADRWDIIRYMAGQPLDLTPGERYAYSNFGYNLLGRVIERVTEQDYESYIQTRVLAPLGVRRMKIGRTARELRAIDEVVYTTSEPGLADAVIGEPGSKVPRPYGAWHLEAMDSHGAWIASAVDLARFVAALDGPDDCPLLAPESYAAMFARPAGRLGFDEEGNPTPTYYAFGWSVKPVGDGFDAGHNGALDGTATGIKLRHDQIGWAVLFNCRLDPAGAHLYGAIEESLHAYVDSGPEWPEWDLFDALA